MPELLDRSWISSPDDVVAFLTRLYAERGSDNYEEDITQSQHALQSAALAEADGASAAMVVAALLHDVGHLVQTEGEMDFGRDDHHERIAVALLSAWFGAGVTEPIALHVAAKRYLVATDPAYADGLSAASVASLVLQGGPMDAAEQAAFDALPGAADACRLRRWDDLAKDPDAVTPPWEHYEPLMLELASLDG